MLAQTGITRLHGPADWPDHTDHSTCLTPSHIVNPNTDVAVPFSLRRCDFPLGVLVSEPSSLPGSRDPYYALIGYSCSKSIVSL